MSAVKLPEVLQSTHPNETETSLRVAAGITSATSHASAITTARRCECLNRSSDGSIRLARGWKAKGRKEKRRERSVARRVGALVVGMWSSVSVRHPSRELALQRGYPPEPFGPPRFPFPFTKQRDRPSTTRTTTTTDKLLDDDPAPFRSAPLAFILPALPAHPMLHPSPCLEPTTYTTTSSLSNGSLSRFTLLAPLPSPISLFSSLTLRQSLSCLSSSPPPSTVVRVSLVPFPSVSPSFSLFLSRSLALLSRFSHRLPPLPLVVLTRIASFRSLSLSLSHSYTVVLL